MPSAMDHVVRNEWRRPPGGPIEQATILDRASSPEGLDAVRTRFVEPGEVGLDAESAHVLSPVRGAGALHVHGERLALAPGVHAFLPRGARATIQGGPGFEVARVSGPSERGTDLKVRDEQFVYACATEGRSLRWTLTPQYLSRRVFLHHDAALTSKSGRPVSWFRTTMFDVAGLPPNEQGEPVFKMAYHSRTEFNLCYDVVGEAGVRMALHPYATNGQSWGPWLDLDGESTYRLHETHDGPRNKHEVRSAGGYTTLFCVFDPAPTGIERHQPGEYSDYEPIERVVARPEYEAHRAHMAELDAMVDRLSLAKARGRLDEEATSPAWQRYVDGRRAQEALERALVTEVRANDPARADVLERWIGGR